MVRTSVTFKWSGKWMNLNIAVAWMQMFEQLLLNVEKWSAVHLSILIALTSAPYSMRTLAICKFPENEWIKSYFAFSSKSSAITVLCSFMEWCSSINVLNIDIGFAFDEEFSNVQMVWNWIKSKWEDWLHWMWKFLELLFRAEKWSGVHLLYSFALTSASLLIRNLDTFTYPETWMNQNLKHVMFQSSIKIFELQ